MATGPMSVLQRRAVAANADMVYLGGRMEGRGVVFVHVSVVQGYGVTNQCWQPCGCKKKVGYWRGVKIFGQDIDPSDRRASSRQMGVRQAET